MKFIIQTIDDKVVHDFFSCGLYGFADHNILPYMFKDWFKEFTKVT